MEKNITIYNNNGAPKPVMSEAWAWLAKVAISNTDYFFLVSNPNIIGELNDLGSPWDTCMFAGIVHLDDTQEVELGRFLLLNETYVDMDTSYSLDMYLGDTMEGNTLPSIAGSGIVLLDESEAPVKVKKVDLVQYAIDNPEVVHLVVDEGDGIDVVLQRDEEGYEEGVSFLRMDGSHYFPNAKVVLDYGVSVDGNVGDKSVSVNPSGDRYTTVHDNNGNMVIVPPELPVLENAKYNTVAHFNTMAWYIANTSIHYNIGADDFEIEVKFKQDAPAWTSMIRNNNYRLLPVILNSAGALQIRTTSDGIDEISPISDEGAFPHNIVHTARIRKSGTLVEFFRVDNGVEVPVGSGTCHASIHVSDDVLRIGYHTAGGPQFNGTIYSCKLSNTTTGDVLYDVSLQNGEVIDSGDNGLTFTIADDELGKIRHTPVFIAHECENTDDSGNDIADIYQSSHYAGTNMGLSIHMPYSMVATGSKYNDIIEITDYDEALQTFTRIAEGSMFLYHRVSPTGNNDVLYRRFNIQRTEVATAVSNAYMRSYIGFLYSAPSDCRNIVRIDGVTIYDVTKSGTDSVYLPDDILNDLEPHVVEIERHYLDNISSLEPDVYVYPFRNESSIGKTVRVGCFDTRWNTPIDAHIPVYPGYDNDRGRKVCLVSGGNDLLGKSECTIYFETEVIPDSKTRYVMMGSSARITVRQLNHSGNNVAIGVYDLNGIGNWITATYAPINGNRVKGCVVVTNDTIKVFMNGELHNTVTRTLGGAFGNSEHTTYIGSYSNDTYTPSNIRKFWISEHLMSDEEAIRLTNQ